MRFGVVTAREEPLEVGVVRRDGPEVLGPVELARPVVVVAVETDGDDLVFVAGGELVIRYRLSDRQSAERQIWRCP